MVLWNGVGGVDGNSPVEEGQGFRVLILLLEISLRERGK